MKTSASRQNVVRDNPSTSSGQVIFIRFFSSFCLARRNYNSKFCYEL